jgi:hypothetical protein
LAAVDEELNVKPVLPLVACVLQCAWMGSTLAQEVNPSTLYELSSEGSSQKVRAGAKGIAVVSIRTKPESHVSSEAPFKLELSGKGVKPLKDKVPLSEAVSKKPVPEGFADPRFEVPFTAESVGKANLDAKLTFFICTVKICARQQKTLSIPIEVE